MNELSFQLAIAELAKLYTTAEPKYARHLSKELFELLRKTLELDFIFQGYPKDMASDMALIKAHEAARATA